MNVIMEALSIRVSTKFNLHHLTFIWLAHGSTGAAAAGAAAAGAAPSQEGL